jgi:hypothetical protein
MTVNPTVKRRSEIIVEGSRVQIPPSPTAVPTPPLDPSDMTVFMIIWYHSRYPGGGVPSRPSIKKRSDLLFCCRDGGI